MDFQQMLDNITPEIYQSLKRAIELGKWPDGKLATKEQKQMCMQAVIAYETKHLPEDQHTGYIPPKPHQHCGGSGDVSEPEEKPLQWKH